MSLPIYPGLAHHLAQFLFVNELIAERTVAATQTFLEQDRAELLGQLSEVLGTSDEPTLRTFTRFEEAIGLPHLAVADRIHETLLPLEQDPLTDAIILGTAGAFFERMIEVMAEGVLEAGGALDEAYGHVAQEILDNEGQDLQEKLTSLPAVAQQEVITSLFDKLKAIPDDADLDGILSPIEEGLYELSLGDSARAAVALGLVELLEHPSWDSNDRKWLIVWMRNHLKKLDSQEWHQQVHERLWRLIPNITSGLVRGPAGELLLTEPTEQDWSILSDLAGMYGDERCWTLTELVLNAMAQNIIPDQTAYDFIEQVAERFKSDRYHHQLAQQLIGLLTHTEYGMRSAASHGILPVIAQIHTTKPLLALIQQLSSQPGVDADNFRHVHRVATALYNEVPPHAHRDYLRQRGDADSANDKLYLYIYAGGAADFAEYESWTADPELFTVSEPKHPAPQETYAAIEHMFRSHATLRPHKKLRLGKYEFEISRVFLRGERPIAVALVRDTTVPDAVIKPRLFYKSHSEGGWRFSPFTKRGKFVKGDHYVAQGRLAQPLVDYLKGAEEAAIKGMDTEVVFKLFEIKNHRLNRLYRNALENDFKSEFVPYQSKSLAALRALKPGQVFRRKNEEAPTMEQLRQLAYPDGFIPDFSQAPVARVETKHEALGPAWELSYDGAVLDGEPIRWTLVVDQAGRAWDRSIRFLENRVNSYGAHNQYIDAGILQYKPLDYGTQLGALDHAYKLPFDDSYYDITPMLAELRPIREFIENADFSFIPPDPAATGELTAGQTFLEQGYDEGILDLPDGNILDLMVYPSSDALDDVIIPELHVEMGENEYTFILTYEGAYELRVVNHYRESRLMVTGQGPDFHYEGVRIGGIGGIRYTIERFQKNVERSKGLVPDELDSERRDHNEDEFLEALVRGDLEDF